MVDSELIFLNTSPLIYLIENNPLFYVKVSSFLSKMIYRNSNFATSVISIAEFGVKPKRTNQLELLEELEEMLDLFEVQVKVITRSMAELSSSIRAKYSMIQNFDALQIAAAIESNCTLFVTNDKKLKVVKEISIHLIDELP